MDECDQIISDGGSLMESCEELEQISVRFVSDGHADRILKVLRGFRDRGLFFDFNIQVQDEILPCHRCVVAACSDFFRYESSLKLP